MENRAWCCQGCNNHKYTCVEVLDSLSGVITPLYNPRTHAWDDHFRWSDDFAEVRVSATGGVTVLILNLNRQELINLRKLLVAFGEHPPQQQQAGTDVV